MLRRCGVGQVVDGRVDGLGADGAFGWWDWPSARISSAMSVMAADAASSLAGVAGLLDYTQRRPASIDGKIWERRNKAPAIASTALIAAGIRTSGTGAPP
jgi:hypothetical protein